MARMSRLKQNLFLQLLSSTDRAGRFRLLMLIATTCLAAITEMVGVTSILPFISLLIDADSVAKYRSLSILYEWWGSVNQERFLFWIGCSALFAIVVANTMNVLTTWLLMRFTWQEGQHLAERLLAHYINLPLLSFAGKNTADMTKNIFTEVLRSVGNVLIPFLTLVARGLLVISVTALIVVIDPIGAWAVVLVLGGVYGLLFLYYRKQVGRTAEGAASARTHAYRVVSEAFGGIREVKLYGLEQYVLKRFSAASQRSALYEAEYQLLAHLPRYVLDTLVFGGLMAAALYLGGRGADGPALAVIAAYAFAGYRLMPNLQQCYAAATLIRANLVSLRMVLDELRTPGNTHFSQLVCTEHITSFDRELRLEDVCFSYDDGRKILTGVSLTVPCRTMTAVIGRTGCGKSTLIDLITGLLVPTSGSILVDGIRLGAANRVEWQRLVGYVPQQVFLIDDSVLHNIAFGVPEASIDRSRVENAARLAMVHDFVVKELPRGYDTVIGERGVNLSGGQRQRIALARALYRQPRLLVLDEATSALDYETEEAIMTALESLSREITIILSAHRLRVAKKCDHILEIVEGTIVPRRSEELGI